MNTKTWQHLGHRLAAHFGEKIKSSDWFMPSATLKVLWFHRPELVPMYDRFALRGLCRNTLKAERGITPATFLTEFEKFHAQSQSLISRAQDLWGTAYPYQRRIADKYLWLRGGDRNGHDDGSGILRRFRTACEILAKSIDKP